MLEDWYYVFQMYNESEKAHRSAERMEHNIWKLVVEATISQFLVYIKWLNWIEERDRRMIVSEFQVKASSINKLFN